VEVDQIGTAAKFRVTDEIVMNLRH